MESSNESEDQVQINERLAFLNHLLLKINNELSAINELLNGQKGLEAAVINANEILTAVAENLNLDLEEILNAEVVENDDVAETPFKILKLLLSSASLEKKLARFKNV